MMTTIRIWLCNCAVVVMNYYSCEVVWDTKNTFSCVANILNFDLSDDVMSSHD
jgi:hypothetical protein